MALPDQIELLKLFQSFLFEAGLSAVSVKNYLSDLRHFLSFCASPTLTTKDIFHHIDRFLDPYLDHQKASFTPASTTARRLASIRRFSTFLSVKFNITNIFTAQTASNNIKKNSFLETTTLQSGLTSEKILEQFKTSLEREKKSHSTVKNYLSDLNHFFLWTANETPFTDQNLVNILSVHLLQSYVTYLKLCHTSTSVINRRQSSIKKLTKFCFEEGYLPENPFELKSVPQTLAPLAWLERLAHKKAKEPAAPKGGLAIIYEKYSSLRWTPYFNLALLVLATTAMAIFAYNQIINQARPSAAATSLTPPKRQLSFQGRLTDSGGTPITTAVSVVFKLFNALTGPTQLYTTGTCSITPDQDGIFNSLIGDTVCGAEIPSSVFTDNRDVYLEITVGAETLTPRQQIATVGYALNSETLQGYPASAAATINTVPVIDNSGNINISVNSPSIISSAGTFTVQGQVLSLKTGTNSGGDIILQPDAIGSGQILALGGTTTEDSFRITNANLTTGALLSGYVGNDLVQGRLISLTSGSTETDRFWVATDGRTSINANATNSAFIVNQVGFGDLISASVSGSPVFTVTNGGSVDITGQYLVNGVPISGGSSNWQLNSGVLTPLQITNSVNIGAVATSSALVHLAGTAAENSFINTGNFGIGDTGPDAKLEVLGTTEQLRLTYTDGTVDSRFTVDSSGNLTIDNTGTKTIIADDLQINGGDILDSNGNESIIFGTTASAVNEATLTNAATGGIVTLAATGGDTDVALSIDAKGSDPLNLNNNGTGDILLGGGSGSTGCTVANATGTLTCTVGITASSIAFSGITSGTNTSAAMVVDTGASLDYSGSGTINASTLIGATWAAPGTIGSGTPNTGAFTTLTSSGNTTLGTDASSVNTLGSVTTPGTLTLHGATTLDNTFTVSGANLTSLEQNLQVAGAATVSGNLLVSGTASVSGALTLFGTPTINTTSNQPLTLSADDTIISGRTTLNGQSYTWPGSQTNAYVLQTNGTGTLSWVAQSAGGSSSNWTIANGAIYPINATLDAFVGGDSTASAKFAFINVDSGTPTASISAGVAGATFLTADGNLSTTARQSLTLGNSATYNTTGDILLSPNGTGNVGIGLTNPTYKLDVNGDIHIATGSDLYIGAIGLNDNASVSSGASLIGLYDDAMTNIAANTTVQDAIKQLDSAIAAAVTNDQFWDSSNGALYPKNSTLDLLIGGQATSSAKFAVLNMNSGTPVASISANTAGNNTYLSGDGILATTNKQSLTLGSTSTGNINVGTDATDRIVTLGNVTGATAVNVNTGTGDITLTSTDLIVLSGAVNSTGGIINLNASSNFATNINTGTSTGAVTIGGGTATQTVAINSADWDISTTGDMTNIGAITMNGLLTGTLGTTITGAIVNLNASSNFATNINTGTSTGAVTIGGGTATQTVAINSADWDISTTGVITNSDSYNGLVVTANTGVITTGTWNGTLIPLAYGGTNKNMTAVNGGVVWTDADSMEVSAAGSAGQVLNSNGAAAPSWIDTSTIGGFWQRNAGALAPQEITNSLNLGATATASALVHLAGTAAENSFINTGNVGIGTTAPGAKLTVGNNIASGFLDNYSEYQILWYDSGSAATSHGIGTKSGSVIFNTGGAFSFDRDGSATSMYINSSGNVGIGTTDPNKLLEISGTTTPGGTIRLNNADTTVLTNESLGEIEFYSNDVSTDGVGVGSKIASVAENNGSWYGLTFSTWDASNGLSERVRIDHKGNVGIGTTGPGLKLDVAGSEGYPANSGTAQTGIARLESSSTHNNILDFGMAGASPWGMWLQATNRTDLSLTYPLLLNPNGGNVGIGITNPGSPLNVANNAAASSGGQEVLRLSANHSGATAGSGAKINFTDLNGNVITQIRSISESSNNVGLAFSTYNTGVSEKLRINAAGNVGIGTTNPDNKLTVYGGNVNIWDDSSLGNELVTNGSMEGTYTAGLAPNWSLSGSPTVSEQTGVTGSAQGVTNGDAGNIVQQNITYVTGKMYKLTVSGKQISGSGTGYVRILSTVIGTSTNVISFNTGSYITSSYYFTSQLTGSSPLRIYADAGTVVAFDNISIKEIAGGNLIARGLLTGGGTSGIKITADGNVGIGTTAPSQKLHVVGNCVTGDTLLPIRRRRRRKSNGLESEDDDGLALSEAEWDYFLCRIDEILPGDEVLSLNESTGALEHARINKLMDMGIRDVYELTTKSGRVIRTTANHPYLTLISSLPCQGEVASRPEGFI